MKIKPVIITLLLCLLNISVTHASTDITGEIYGETFQNMTMSETGTNAQSQPYSYAVTIEDIADETEDCDSVNLTCNIKGLSWSDRVGWTFWDGLELQSELGGAANFPDEFIAKAAFNGNIGGYVWGEKFGWISLSRCGGLGDSACAARPYCEWTGSQCEINKAERVPDVGDQDEGDWGVYVDFCFTKDTQTDCESAASSTYCNWDPAGTCVFDAATNPNGQPIRGFAWSEYLGWVKFGPETGETDFSGAFTTWFPDLTPPDPVALTFISGYHAWLPSENSSGALIWLEFADEKESNVDPFRSFITVTPVDNGPGEDFEGCPDVVAPYPNGDTIISPGSTGEVHVTIPEIGALGTPPLGYCQYTLEGALYNMTGLGFYFGPGGLAQAALDGVDYSTPETADPHTYINDPITISVRAGSIITNSPGLLTDSGNNTIADGLNSTVDLTFRPRDASNNLIVSVQGDLDGNPIPGDSSNWIRRLELLYDMSGSPYAYDSLSILRNLSYPAPVQIEDYLTFLYIDPLQYPAAGISEMLPEAGAYRMKLTGFAPSTVPNNNLTLSKIDFNPNDIGLPAISPMTGPWAPVLSPIALNNTNTSALPFNYLFNPALIVSDGSLNTDFLAINQPAEATFTYQNNSAEELTEFGLDHILDFHDEGANSELLEVEEINLVSLGDMTGRTDPNGPGTRYALIPTSAVHDASINEFHNTLANYHEPGELYNFGGGGLDPDGQYAASGNAFVSPSDECIAAGTCTPVDIDRGDLLSAGSLPSGNDDSFTFGFTPTRFIGGGGAGQISFDIIQYLSYDTVNNLFAQQPVYLADPWITDIQVKSIGLDTSGTVSGQQVYDSGGGRDLATVTTTSSADLRREIRRNIAVLTRNMTACEPGTTPITLTTLASDCVSVDTQNKTVVAYYTGDANDVITLGDGTDITIPDGYRYTIILEAVNLNLTENLKYPDPADPNTSFGMIVTQDSDGNGGNVYLDPEPTNMVGLLYAEGSLFSSPDAGASVYYAGALPSASDLTNQLLWQGSIASRNTIGGASNMIVPEGADCSRWGDIQGTCSQGYDLDFVRRFTTIKESGTGDQYAPTGILFSGGGSCEVVPPIICILPGSLPTAVNLISGTNPGSTVIDPDSKSLDAFFIERDNRPVPPGFSSKGGLTSTREIR